MTSSSSSSRGGEQKRKPSPPHHRFPRWAWILVIGLAVIAIVSAGAQTWTKTRRASINADFPVHQDLFVGWKTFISQSGWRIRYPNNWTISSCHACNDPTEKGIFVDINPPLSLAQEGFLIIQPMRDRLPTQSLDQLFTDLKQFPAQPHLSEERTSLNGFPALKIVYGKFGAAMGEAIYLVNNRQVVEVNFFGAAYPRSELRFFKNYSIYQQILSTFKFIEPAK